ncbi:transposase [Bdellovibrio sp.]|uniref:transposase n=1 Tax=Bdellovibrio sp. TaxID=28201 RepID=UPI0039E36681
MAQLSIHHRKCPHCGSNHFVKRGYFYKQHTKTYIPRYNCKSCNKTFSTRTLSPTFRQKRTDLNPQVFQYLTSGASIRATAKALGCTYKTAYLKFLWLSKRAQDIHQKQRFSFKELYFDEMLSIEHTKLKPLTVALAVSDNYEILGVQVGKIPAQGKIASISRRKYGYRPNESSVKTQDLLTEVKRQALIKRFTIKSDSKPEYHRIVKKIFSNLPYEQFISKENKDKRREQKYLKTEKHIFDPLFPINHICARSRDLTKRLVRRSWCTTKVPEHLERALYLLIAKNNKYRLFS